MNTGELPTALREYFAAMGRKGGSVKGDSKKRGDAEFYSRIARMKKSRKSQENSDERR